MYLINKTDNCITELEKKTFADLQFKERDNLQEWIAKNPSCLGEELLIIQKEFNGFNDTNERLDLLALDKLGNLVIIENKLDDSGKDVTWQAIKYASYCSSLTKQDIVRIYQEFLGSNEVASDRLSDFFEGKSIDEIVLNMGSTSQRLILVAANFRKEVTSSVLWLSHFKMRIQCFKVTPYAFSDQLLLNIEQILPTKDTEDLVISMANKAQDELQVQETLKNRHIVRLEFWETFLNEATAKTKMFTKNSPSKESWIGLGLGVSGVSLNLGVSGNYCRAEIYINKGDKALNKQIFDFLEEHKEKIKQASGVDFVWERMNDNMTSRVKYQLDNVDLYEKEDWPKMIDFLILSSELMVKSFEPIVGKLNKTLLKTN